ncbi:MAG: type II toxin-antitoxin system VapC family toxin [Chloroflexi bacterium]|nr:type II toxin-antitoxin system VapC family toxin [Chloroflexota bacterium]
MPTPRRLWDSCIVIGYLSGQQYIKTDCDQIIQQAERGELEIVVSTVASAEVAFLPHLSDSDSELKIQEFFSRKYVVIAAFDISVARIVRRLIRDYKNLDPPLKPADAIHIATALQWQIPIIETTDPDLLRLDGKEGNPRLIIRRPFYEGPGKLL